MFLFAITDIDTQRDLSSFFGRTKITRIQKGANPKAKPDVREEEIELIDDNVIKLLEVGNHITYMPKAKGTLYVGYTQYPNLPKTQEGYLRQGKDVEDDFILFKQGLLESKDTHREDVVPEVLYLAVEEHLLKNVLNKNIMAPSNGYIQLHRDKNNALSIKANTKNVILLKIDAKKMYEDNNMIYETVKNQLLVKVLPYKYFNKIKYEKEAK